MGIFSEVVFSEVKEVKTNVSVLVIYWFQNTYFIHFIRLAPIFKIGVNGFKLGLIGFLEHSENSEHSEALTSNF